ncbi:MAG: menaquinone biosynthesis decarboxylase [Planctomycetota bacterium]|jgi:4-hydroxy-3-polyprenylbenzoate decarboxylase
MHASLGEFIAALDRAGELHRVRTTVSPLLEISEITDRQAKLPCAKQSPHAQRFDPGHCQLGGRGLLFENVEGSDFPLLINAYGSYTRTEMALGGPFEEIARRIASLTKPEPPRSLGAALSKAKEFLPLLRVPPKRVSSGPCQEVVNLDPDLTRLPILKCWPLDGDPEAVGYPVPATNEGRYITFAGIHTIHHRDKGAAKPASHNVGMYRLQLLGPKKLAMHWHMHHDGAAHWRSWKKAGEKMPVAIALGGEAVLPYAATAPLPPGISELLMAGFLHGKGIPMVAAKTVPLRVPANAEIIIEGHVSTQAGFPGYDPRSGEPIGEGAVFEGPFGDHTGYYSLPDRYPVVEVTAITHRRDAVYPTTIVGLPPQEDYYLGKATERIFLPLLKTILHDLDDYHLPMFGCFHNCAFVRIRKEYPLQARRVMHAIWGAGQMAWTKVIVVVDDEVDVHDEEAVWRAVLRNCHFGRDLEFVNGPLDILDHAAPRLGAGGKMGIDATRKIAGEEVNGVPHDAVGSGKRVFVAVDKQEAGDGIRALEQIDADLAIAVDEETDDEATLFRWCANWDPIRDTLIRDGQVGFDATTKLTGEQRNGQPCRDFPPILKMDDATKAKVDNRWTEYGF